LKDPFSARQTGVKPNRSFSDEVDETMGLLQDVSVHGEDDASGMNRVGSEKAKSDLEKKKYSTGSKATNNEENLRRASPGAVVDNFATQTSLSTSSSSSVKWREGMGAGAAPATDLFAASSSFADEHVFASVVSSLPQATGNNIDFGAGDFDPFALAGAGITGPTAVNLSRNVSPQNKGKERENVPFVLPAPKVRGTSQILSLEQMTQMRDRLPPILHIDAWKMVYSLLSDGADMSSFYRNTRRRRNFYLVVRTLDGDVFGGFLAAEIKQSPDYYGSGECFLYRFDSEGEMTTYRWTGANEFFILSTGRSLAMGGGGDGFGFVIDADFEGGETSACKTFDNPPLAARSPSGHFKIQDIEVWGFESEYA
jgi:hypothetical protein